MKKLLLVVLMLVSLVSFASAESGLTHFDSRSAFSMDYPADRLTLVSDDVNTILRSVNLDEDLVLDVMCPEGQTDDPAAWLANLMSEYGLTVTADDIATMTTAAGGQVWVLRRMGVGCMLEDYIIHEGEREFIVSVLYREDLPESDVQQLHDVVLSIAVNPDMPFVPVTADEAEYDWEPDFYDEMLDLYAPVLRRYCAAVTEHWDRETLEANGLCTLLALSDTDPSQLLNDIHVDFVDLDDSGRYVLVLYTYPADGEGTDVLAMHSMTDDGFVPLAMSHERSLFSLYGSAQDGYIIGCAASSSAFQSGFFYFKRSGEGLEPVQVVMFQGDENETAPWYLTCDLDWDVSNDTPITEEEAMAIIEGYQPCIDLDASFTLEDFAEIDAMGV